MKIVERGGCAFSGSPIDGGGVRARAARADMQKIACYGLAACLGIGLSLWLFPVSLIFLLRDWGPPFGDAATHAAGQLALIKDQWRWPPLETELLMAHRRINIGLTDSIPIEALFLKLIRSFIPGNFHGIYLWLAICWALQPVCFVFALRSMNARFITLEIAFFSALLAVCIPLLYLRDGHAALSAQFIILLAIGFYFHLCRDNRWSLVVSSALAPVVFLVNPYLAAMYVAMLGAAPITLFFRNNPRWMTALSCWVAAIAATAIVGALFGYTAAVPEGGFGFYSMNLLSPIYPGGSRLLSGLPSFIDGTGGQYEGYAYPGFGIIGLLFLTGVLSVPVIRDFAGRHKACYLAALCLLSLAAVYSIFNGGQLLLLDRLTHKDALIAIAAAIGLLWLLCLARGDFSDSLRRHIGLCIICVGLVLFALSTKIYVGEQLVLDLGSLRVFEQFRTSGRFIWPVVYLCATASVAYVTRRLDRPLAAAFLMILSTLQVIDTGGLRYAVALRYHTPNVWTVDAELLRGLLPRSRELTIWPAFNCGARVESPMFEQLVLLAIEAGVPANSMRVSRRTADFHCPPASYALRPIGEHELRALLPDNRPGAWQSIEDADRFCRPDGAIVICSRLLDASRSIAELPIGKEISLAAGQPGAGILDRGWSPEPWGAWSDGYVADLLFRTVPGAVTLSLKGSGFVPPSPTINAVGIHVNGGFISAAHLTSAEQEFRIEVPAAANPVGLMHVVVQFFPLPRSPRELGMSDDPRHLGIALKAVRVEPPSASSQLQPEQSNKAQ